MYFITTKRMLEVCFFQHTPTFIIEPLIYANNGSKSALARDLVDCRDNKGKLAKRVFICLTGNFLLSKRARCANEMHLWKKKIGAGDRARREEKAVR